MILMRFLQEFVKGKLSPPRLKKSADRTRNLDAATPIQFDLRCPAAKHNTITRTAAVGRNHDGAIKMRFATSLDIPACIYAHGSGT